MDMNKEINDQQGGWQSWAVARKVASMGASRNETPTPTGNPGTSKPSLKIPNSFRVTSWDQGRHDSWFDAFRVDFTQSDPQNVPRSFQIWKFCPEQKKIL